MYPGLGTVQMTYFSIMKIAVSREQCGRLASKLGQLEKVELENGNGNGKGRGKWKGSSVRFYFQGYEVVQTITWHLS